MVDHTVQNTPEETPRSSGRVSPLLVIFLLTGIMGFVVAAALLLSSEKQTNTSDETAKVLNSAAGVRPLRDWDADPFTLPALDGEMVSLSDYEGRVIFLNFWRTDCEPCVREMPAMQAFMDEQDADGAVVLAVNQGENAEQVTAFLDKLGVEDVEVLLDENFDLEEDYPIPGLPTTYIIAEDGFVRLSKLGEMTRSEMYQYLDTVAQGG